MLAVRSWAWLLTIYQEADKAAKEQEKREFDIARGNPLLNPKDFNVKRRYVLALNLSQNR
jgi:hypothetical protein